MGDAMAHAPAALLGGTFDPVHLGHLGLADDARRALGIPEVRLMPAGDPPHRAAPGASERESSPARLALQGFVVGSFTGLVGAGGGFLIVPALVLWAGLPMPAAIGTSLLVIVLNSLAGFAGHATQVPVDYGLIAAIAGCAIAGSYAGSRLSRLVPPASLRRVFAGFVLVMAAVILVREGNLVLQTGASAMPATLPQLLFALAMLVIGVIAGRASRGSGKSDATRFDNEDGSGI